jgi:hypothetical protein
MDQTSGQSSKKEGGQHGNANALKGINIPADPAESHECVKKWFMERTGEWLAGKKA